MAFPLGLSVRILKKDKERSLFSPTALSERRNQERLKLAICDSEASLLCYFCMFCKNISLALMNECFVK